MSSETDLALSDLKRWRQIRNWSIWTFLPGVLLVSNVLFRLTHVGLSLLIVCACWMFSTGYAVMRVRRWSCPNCGKCLMQKGWFHNDFTSKCLHCGLALKT